MPTYTLADFELIDSLLNAVQLRPELEEVYHCRTEALERYYRPEWRLLDALCNLLGYAHVDSFASAEECAADFVTRCLSSATLVEAA